jgi:hypothetical protein
MLSTSRSGTLKLSPDDREIALLGSGIRVPIVDARFLSTKLNKNGPELSDAIEVPFENVERRSPPLEERWLIADDARDDQPHIEDSGRGWAIKNIGVKINDYRLTIFSN